MGMPRTMATVQTIIQPRLTTRRTLRPTTMGMTTTGHTEAIRITETILTTGRTVHTAIAQLTGRATVPRDLQEIFLTAVRAVELTGAFRVIAQAVHPGAVRPVARAVPAVPAAAVAAAVVAVAGNKDKAEPAQP